MSLGSAAVELTLTAATLLQFAFVHPSDTNNEAVDQIYFGVAHEVAEASGLKHLITLDVVEAEHADIQASAVIVYQWPTLDAWQAFQNDTRWQQALAERDRSFRRLADIYFEVPETTTITFEPDGLYEIAAFWMNHQNGGLMTQYFERMGALVQAAQVQPQAQMSVVETGSHYAEVPGRLALLRWEAGREARDAIFASREFQENGYLRALALDRLWTMIVMPASPN